MLHNVKIGAVKSDTLSKKLLKEIREQEHTHVKEKVLVKKKTEKQFKYVEIDHIRNNEEMAKVRKMMNKNNVADVFFDLEKNVAKKNVRKFLKYKYIKNNSIPLYDKLSMLISLGSIHGELYLLIL